ncbi:MAG TPA: sigma 54-interacting transcriptional regulator [Thermoanaerobacterales bacterium]|nr:sigma 54-interacting transcriptional regulator [Thermoanaerobacterales bacterium]
MKPLKRKDKVQKKLRELTESLEPEKCGDGRAGFDASFIGGLIGVSRNNTSKELNRLVREGRAIKIEGKPVLYLDKYVLESKWGLKLDGTIIKKEQTFRKTFHSIDDYHRTDNKNKEVFKFKEIVGMHKSENRSTCSWPQEKFNINNMDSNSLADKSVLDQMIGAQESLKSQVEQAKAAVLYPPSGLHTLIVGPTGVGKTTFAEAMYRYAVEVKRLPPAAPFVVFNCADYAENPQLLMSQLFGHVKGAFTGADREKQGLVDNANGGILFLDEVHRLPPEGQEMMFLLMDKGIYRRLGESENTRKVRILIIAATTEEPETAMLQTFLRRIPVVIRLPGLDERTLQERMALICRFFRDESARIKAPIKVSKEVIKAFMLYDCPGNIGQLRSDIQLICARAFLDFITFKKEIMEVKLSQLSQRVREGFFKIGEKREELIKNFNLNDSGEIVFDGQDTSNGSFNDVLLLDKYNTGEDFYGIIQNTWKRYAGEGLSDKQIREKIDEHIKDYFESFFSQIKPRDTNVDREALTKVVSPRVLEAVEEVLQNVSDEFKGTLSRKVIYGIALHVGTLMERLRLGAVISHPDKNIAKEHEKEYEAATKIRRGLQERLNVKIPEDEVAYLAMFLYAVKSEKSQGNIGVLVIAHGDAAASTMAKVANALLGVDHARALDMPLEEKVEVILDKAVEEVRKIDRGKGVLILVDMGSLVTFSELITEKTGIPTRVVEMVSTPMVIEATRKSLMPDMDLDTLVEDVKSLSPYIGKDRGTKYTTHVNEYGGRFFQGILVDILGNTLTFLNPQKACNILNDVLEKILAEFGERIDEDITIKFLFHCSCMVERIIKGEPLPYNNLEELKKERNNVFAVLKKHFELIEEVFGINIPDAELAYVVEMLDTHFDTLAIKTDAHA